MMDIGVGICTGHSPPIPMTGIIIATATKTLTNSLPTALSNDLVVGGCGHVGQLIATTIKLITQNKRTVRMSDPFTGTFSGTIVTGSPTVYSS